MTARIHASCVAIGDHAVLLIGKSGSGKSDLALRLIDRGATLVSDDYTELECRAGALIASAPATIRGKIELRGIGIVTMPHREQVRVALAARLDQQVQRMPAPGHERIEDVDIPLIALDAREASAPIKLEIALARLVEGAR